MELGGGEEGEVEEGGRERENGVKRVVGIAVS